MLVYVYFIVPQHARTVLEFMRRKKQKRSFAYRVFRISRADESLWRFNYLYVYFLVLCANAHESIRTFSIRTQHNFDDLYALFVV